MKTVKISRSYLSFGTLKVGVEVYGFRKLNFLRMGLMEEGLALVFKHKPVTRKSLLRIEGLVRELTTIISRYEFDPRKTDIVPRIEFLMKKLCGKIGQLESIVSNRSERNSNIQLAKRALELMVDHCDVEEFGEQAKRLLRKAEERTQIFHRREAYAYRGPDIC